MTMTPLKPYLIRAIYEWVVDLEGGGERWGLFMRSTYMPAGFSTYDLGRDYYDHYLDGSYQFGRKLDLGFRARY